MESVVWKEASNTLWFEQRGKERGEKKKACPELVRPDSDLDGIFLSVKKTTNTFWYNTVNLKKKEKKTRRSSREHEQQLIYNQWRAKRRKFLKECDCCRKEWGLPAQRSARLAVKAMAEGRGRRRCQPGGHRPARKWILHTAQIIARFRAVRLHLGSRIVLDETVSPHLCLAVFLCPAVNKAGLGGGGVASPHMCGYTSQSDLARGLCAHPTAQSSGRRIQTTTRQVTKRGHLGMTESGPPFRNIP